MNPLKKIICWLQQHPKTIWCITIMYALLMFYLSSVQITQPIEVETLLLSMIEHIVEYTIMGFLLLISFISIKRDSVWIVILLACLYGVSDEIHQLFTPGRFFSVYDIAADCVGAVAGTFIGKYGMDKSGG